MSWGSARSTSPPPRAITRTSSASLPIWSARVWCVASCPGLSRWAAVCGAWKGAGSWTCRGPPRCCSGCIAAVRPPPGRDRAAGWTCRRRTACWDTSSHTTPSPRRCARLIRRAPTGRSRCGMRSWPTRRTRPPAVAAGCWFLARGRWMREWVPARLPRRLAAVAGARAAATAFTVWNQSVVNEKVYTLSLLSIALVLWLIVRWDDQPAGEAHDHHLLMIVFLLALTSTNHMMGVLVGPAVVVLLFPPLKSQRPTDEAGRSAEWSQWGVFCSVFALIVASGLENVAPLIIAGVLFLLALGYAVVYARNGDFAVAVLLVAIVGVSVYLFLPIRAAHYPPINEGEPTTWKTLWEVLTRQQYGKPPVWERQASLGAQIGMWFQYFSWQWGRDWYDSTFKLFGLVLHWQRALAVVFFGVGVLGAVRHWVADRRRAIAMTLLMATFTLFLIFYLNFKYGYSWQPEKQLAREVRERDYFFIASFALWGVWVGMGLATLMEWVSDSLEVRVPDAARRWTLATPLLLLALIPLVGNNLTASRKGETLARDFAFDLLQSVEPYGVLVTAGDNDTFPLWYAQEVEHVRQDVTVRSEEHTSEL